MPPRGVSNPIEIRLSKTACPEAFPLWDTAEPSSPPSCGVCPTSGVERGVALRLAPGRTGRAVGVAWPPAGGAGGLQGARSRGAHVKMPFVFPIRVPWEQRFLDQGSMARLQHVVIAVVAGVVSTYVPTCGVSSSHVTDRRELLHPVCGLRMVAVKNPTNRQAVFSSAWSTRASRERLLETGEEITDCRAVAMIYVSWVAGGCVWTAALRAASCANIAATTSGGL
jgi:hypothetical protein